MNEKIDGGEQLTIRNVIQLCIDLLTNPTTSNSRISGPRNKQSELHGPIRFVLDPYRFRIIKDAWNNTDKHDARNMAKALSMKASSWKNQ